MENQTRKPGKRKVKASRIGVLIIVALVLVIGGVYAIRALVGNPQKVESVVILSYHHLVNEEEKKIPDFVNNDWVMTTTEFEQQMQYLYDHDYETISLDELNNWYHGEASIPEKSVIITFDDGYLSAVHYGVPILKKFNYTAATFVVGATVKEKKLDWAPKELQTVTLEDMADPENTDTMAFYSHTYGLHSNINGYAAILAKTKDELVADFKKSEKVHSIDYVAYPFGVSSPTYIEAAKEVGVKLGFEFGTDRPAKKTDDPFLLPRYCIKPGMPIETFANFFK